jgi:CotH kinase protein/Chitobiase/beta-hexosaminidase C-terminal domain/Lamin Tail Domain
MTFLCTNSLKNLIFEDVKCYLSAIMRFLAVHISYFFLAFMLLACDSLCAQSKVVAPPSVQFSQPAGHYKGSVTLQLKAKAGATIYYTLDGAKPNEKSSIYSGPITIYDTKVVRAMASNGHQYSGSVTQSYLIDEPTHGLPIISVTMSPSTLFHPRYGIMLDGAYADHAQEHKPGANYWTRKEYLCNVEVFEDDLTCVHNSPAGFRIFGGYSRVFPQKSFVLVNRKRYGSTSFDGDILPVAGVKKLKYLVLRNGGSDWNGTHFRDELMSSLMDNWGVDKQGYRPAVVYLNGKYWGIYQIREKINTRFINDHHQVDQDSIDLLEHKNTVRAGSQDSYNKLLQFIETHDLSKNEHYARVVATMEIDNYIDYQIAQFYCVNNDAGGNIRFWKTKNLRDKWRWVFFDMDWGFGLHNPEAYKVNSFKFFTEANGPTWPNPPWSTFILRNLLKNDQFKARFINRMCDRLDNDFKSERVLTKIGGFQKILQPDIQRHLTRWSLSNTDWLKSIETASHFAEERPYHMRTHMEQYFGLTSTADIEVIASVGGRVMVNGAVKVESGTYKGHYYEQIPIELVAKPHRGYRFVGWEGYPDKKPQIQVTLQAAKLLRIKPKFEAYEHPLADAIMINEICPYNKKTGDWLEIYNSSTEAVRLDGWKLSDATSEFTLPQVEIESKNYVIICRNAAKFKQKHPLVTQPIIDGLNFGLDKAVESLVLTTPAGDLIDTISYRLEPPATDYTVDLLLPTLNNEKPNHWGVNLGLGSPALDNPLLFAQLTGSQKDLWVRIGLGIGILMLALTAIKWQTRQKTAAARK